MRDEPWMNTLIAPNLSVADWYRLRARLNPDVVDGRWRRVISAVNRRLTLRFIEPADALIKREVRRRRLPRGPGFAVLALDCLLIETLDGYERGRRSTNTSTAFRKFLRRAEDFAHEFGEDGRAASFANAIRNGLLHDGETRKGWLIWKASPEGSLLRDLGDGRLVLYRDDFHAAVRRYAAGYFQRLRADDGADLRRKLIRRLNRVCRDCAPSKETTEAPAAASSRSRGAVSPSY